MEAVKQSVATEPTDRREALCAWLTANGADPDEVPSRSDMTISTDDDGTRWLHYEQYALTDGGRYMNAWNTGAAVDKHTVRLIAEPPDWWEPQVNPTRETLTASRDHAYLERDYALALLAIHYAAVISPANDMDDRVIGCAAPEPDWQALVITVQNRPLRFNIAPESAELFKHVERVPTEDPRAQPGSGGVAPDRVAHQLWRDKLPLPEARKPTRDQLLTAVSAVGKLHVRNANTGTCEHCSKHYYPGYDMAWPCPTMRALSGVTTTAEQCRAEYRETNWPRGRCDRPAGHTGNHTDHTVPDSGLYQWCEDRATYPTTTEA